MEAAPREGAAANPGAAAIATTTAIAKPNDTIFTSILLFVLGNIFGPGLGALGSIANVSTNPIPAKAARLPACAPIFRRLNRAKGGMLGLACSIALSGTSPYVY